MFAHAIIAVLKGLAWLAENCPDNPRLGPKLLVGGGALRLPATHLVDPHAAKRRIRGAKPMLPVLLWKENKLRNKLIFPSKAAPVLPAINPSLEVF